MKVFCKECKYLLLLPRYIILRDIDRLYFIVSGFDIKEKEYDTCCTYKRNKIEVDESNFFESDSKVVYLLHPSEINYDNKCPWFEAGEHFMNKFILEYKKKRDRGKNGEINDRI